MSPHLSASLLMLVVFGHPAVAGDSRQSAIEFRDDTGLDAFIGFDVDELISRLGQPDRVLALPTGKRAFAYDASQRTHQRQDGSRCADAYVVDSDNMVVDYYCR